MITVRREADLDHARLDWLNARHHFVVTPDGNKAHDRMAYASSRAGSA